MSFTATNVAVTAATINSGNAAMIAAQKEQELLSNCKNYVIPDFDNQIATVEQKQQQYATCIQHVYPEESGEYFDKDFCQATLIWIAISMLVGCYFYYKDKDFVNFFFGTFFGMCGTLGVGLVIALLYGAFN